MKQLRFAYLSEQRHRNHGKYIQLYHQFVMYAIVIIQRHHDKSYPIEDRSVKCINVSLFFPDHQHLEGTGFKSSSAGVIFHCDMLKL